MITNQEKRYIHMNLDKKYSYDDLLLEPQRSDVETRDDVSLKTKITPNIEVDSPLVSAPMDSVTGPEMAQTMADNGGVGILHRFKDWEERREWVREIDGIVGASIGVSEKDLAIAIQLEKAGADFICVDVAHAHLDKVINFIEELNNMIEVDIMVGNVATSQGVKDLVKSGADSIKVGIGPGSVCTTRQKTGHGVPQASAVADCSNTIFGLKEDYTIVADGGIRKPGDAVKALMLGADTVMMGSIFGRTEESPCGGDVWGMASENGNSEEYIEGVISQSEEQYTVEDVFDFFEEGIRSGLSYTGSHDIQSGRIGAEFSEITASTKERNGSFRNQGV
jgi:IMP dehydrogenase